jgi:lipid-A-disaccharide synthase-like uncharacterized protein
MTIIGTYLDRLGGSLTPWAVLGFCGQAVFAARFLVQWMHSERVGRSEIPLLFWYFSLAGGVALLAYAIHIANAVFIVGQAGGLLVYARNLQLIFRERRAAAATAR